MIELGFFFSTSFDAAFDFDAGVLLPPYFVPSLSFDFTNSEKISDVSLVCGSKSGKECEIPCWGGRPIDIRPGGIFSERLKLYASVSHPGANFED